MKMTYIVSLIRHIIVVVDVAKHLILVTLGNGRVGRRRRGIGLLSNRTGAVTRTRTWTTTTNGELHHVDLVLQHGQLLLDQLHRFLFNLGQLNAVLLQFGRLLAGVFAKGRDDEGAVVGGIFGHLVEA